MSHPSPSKPEGAPLRVPPGPEQRAWLEALRKKIHEGSHITRWHGHDSLVVEVEIPGHKSVRGYWRGGPSANVDVSFSGDELQVHDGQSGETVPLSSVEQLQAVIDRVRERLLEHDKKRQRREKLRKLKERAVETQVDALAARLDFAYALVYMVTKVKVIVRLDAQNGVAVDVPHKRLQEVLTELPRLLEILRDLYKSGARFKVIPLARVKGFREPGRA